MDTAQGISYQEWVRRKDAEKRLKSKLIFEAKREMRIELLEQAKEDKQISEDRVAQMEEWLY